MLSLGRTTLILIPILLLVYTCLFFYFREGAKMRLEEDWVQEGRPGDREAWVGERLEPHATRIRRRLIIPVLVLPVVGLSAFVYLTSGGA